MFASRKNLPSDPPTLLDTKLSINDAQRSTGISLFGRLTLIQPPLLQLLISYNSQQRDLVEYKQQATFQDISHLTPTAFFEFYMVAVWFGLAHECVVRVTVQVGVWAGTPDRKIAVDRLIGVDIWHFKIICISRSLRSQGR